MTKKSKFYLLLFSIVFVFSCLLTCFAPTLQNYCVYASSIGVVGGYSNVLDDLQKDADFYADKYIYNGEDYSLQVLNVAESNDNELFVYVYQPCSPNEDLTATSIKISRSIGRNLSYKLYTLTLLNSSGCFHKYRVNNFVVSTAITRYYDISAIHRRWNEKYDKGLSATNENIISETPFAVGKEFTFVSSENGIDISCKDIDLIKITDKYVGFCRYTNGRMPIAIIDPNRDVDGHFVAFSTDRDIDRLMEADVFYRTQSRTLRVNLGFIENEKFGNIEDNYSYLKYADKVTVTPEFGYGLTYNEYTWDRIQTAEDFVATEDREYMYNGVLFNSSTEVKMTDEGLQDIKNMQWVLRFAETEYTQVVEGAGLLSPYEETQVLVSDVSILRLAFETDGVFYNLGVVDNLQSGDGNPDNYTKTTFEMTDTFKVILAILLLIVLLIVLAPILPTIFNILFAIIKILLKVVIWVITAPFKLISKVFKKQENTRKRN